MCVNLRCSCGGMRSLPAALVTGASRGLGLEFCRQLLHARPSATVLATCRDPLGASAEGLRSLQSMSAGRLEVRALDVASEASIEALGAELKEAAPSTASSSELRLLVNCAGILSPDGKGETSLRGVGLERLQTTMATNAFGPLLMAKHIGGLMQQGGSSDLVTPRIVNLSARVGSIGDNRLGGW